MCSCVACVRAEHIDKLLVDPKAPPAAARVQELLALRAQAGAMGREELAGAFSALSILSPSSQSPLSAPFPFNLMFETQIGPTGKFVGYLRPETAQGIFVNYRRLLDFNNGRMPFACAQVGLAFRNEIAPRQGLLRVREFTLAEIEHFVQPDRKQHPKFQVSRAPHTPPPHSLSSSLLLPPSSSFFLPDVVRVICGRRSAWSGFASARRTRGAA